MTDPFWPALNPDPGRPGLDDWLEAHLFDKRALLLRGPLDDAAAMRVASELMTLDASGDEAIRLQLDSPGGPLEAAFAVADVIDALGVPVEVLCMGRVESSAVLVAAVCPRRSALDHCRFRLCDPPFQVAGSVRDLESQLAYQRSALERYHERLALATGRELAEIEADMERGGFRGAEEAVAYGIVDRVVRRKGTDLRPVPPVPRG